MADPAVAADLVARYRPQTLVLNAGAAPPVGSITEQTWETFSTNWNVDVRHVFSFIQAALTAPLAPGSVVVSLSSGAALLEGMGGELSASQAGTSIGDLAVDDSFTAPAYLLGASGLQPLD